MTLEYGATSDGWRMAETMDTDHLSSDARVRAETREDQREGGMHSLSDR